MPIPFDFLLAWAGMAVSFTITFSLLWLGGMVLLIGSRRNAGTWLVGAGLLTGALFFTSHTAILGRGLADTGFGMNFWWWVSWTPAAAAPLAWYAAMLWHAGFRFQPGHPHRFWFPLAIASAALTALLIVFANPLPTYQYVANRGLEPGPVLLGLPALVVAYLLYSLLCYLLPLDLLSRPGPAGDALSTRSRELARPWLAAASLAMLLAGGLLVWAALWALLSRPLPSLSVPGDERIVRLLDLGVSALVALAVTLLGRSIVAYEVFTGRVLPRDRFYHQWRSTVLLALGFGGLAGFAVALSVRPVYSFLLATALLAAFTVLYSFTAYADRESFLSRLRPFVASQNLVNEIAGQPAPGGRPPDDLFEALCADILGARAAALIPSTRLPAVSGPALVYPRGSGLVLPDLEPWQARFTRVQRCLPTGHPRLAWAVPLWSAQGLAGALFLDEKTGGGPYSEEEIELAQAAGERLLDLQAGSELARLSLELLRQRVAQSRVLEGQSRRVLHDEVLPELHSSILYLSGLSNASPEARQAVETLSAAHRRISNLLRAVSPGTPARLAEDGLAAALRLLADNEFAGDFQDVDWQVDSAAEARARELPAFTAEVVYFAVRELLRNARKYARGGDAQRPLRLRLCLASSGGGLTLSVEDDGVGLRTTEPAGEAANPGGSGLRLHSAMLAAVGASLELGPRPGGGTRAVIRI